VVTNGTPSPLLTDDDIHTRRKLAARWLEWACGADEGGAVAERHPRYQTVTEGRDRPTPGYSSCGDLAHWLLYRLGVREAWVNRAEHRGWRVGVNVSRLVTNATLFSGQALECGDVLVIANQWPSGTDAHVVCVLHDLVEGGKRVTCTAEYGQPGGALKTYAWDGTRLGRRRVRVVLPLETVLRKAFHRGLLVAPLEF